MKGGVGSKSVINKRTMGSMTIGVLWYYDMLECLKVSFYYAPEISVGI